MKFTSIATALAFVASVSVAQAQHGGGHGGGHSGGHSGGGHSSGSHSSGSHSSGAHSSSGHSSGSSMAQGRTGGASHGSATARGNNGSGSANADPAPPPGSRPRDGRDPIGTAAPRGTVPSAPPSSVVSGRLTPFGFSTGLLLPALYSRSGFYGADFFDPWYGGYYPWSGADPWYGWGAEPSTLDDGTLRLKVKPSEAQVFVEGYYVGNVAQFDGVFQKLHVSSGAHRIEIRADGYEPLDFDVQVVPGRKITYTGELKRIR